MGFFTSMFGRDWRAFKKRGDQYFADKEWGRARGEYAEALSRWRAGTPEDDLAKLDLRDKMGVVCYRLFKAHIERAEEYEFHGSTSHAIEAYRDALEFASPKENPEAILDQIAQLELALEAQSKAFDALQRKAGAPEANERSDNEVPVEIDIEETFVALLGALDEWQADVYTGFDESFRKAYVALMEGRLEDAEPIATLYEAEPSNPHLAYELGRLRVAQGKYEEGRRLLTQACEALPEMVGCRHALVDALWGLEAWDQAERVIEEAFEIDDELEENFLCAGESCLRSGEFENGCEILEQGIEIHEKSLPMHRLLAKLETARENYDGAINAFESVLRLKWDYSYESKTLTFDRESAFLAAELYLKQSFHLERAEELYRALLASDEKGPARWSSMVGLGRVKEAQGHTEAARGCFVEAASLVPEDSEHRPKIDELLTALG